MKKFTPGVCAGTKSNSGADLCYVLLKDGGESLHMTVKYGNGYGVNPDRYSAPRSFS